VNVVRYRTVKLAVSTEDPEAEILPHIDREPTDHHLFTSDSRLGR
jgi:hypothetical protein